MPVDAACFHVLGRFTIAGKILGIYQYRIWLGRHLRKELLRKMKEGSYKNTYTDTLNRL